MWSFFLFVLFLFLFTSWHIIFIGWKCIAHKPTQCVSNSMRAETVYFFTTVYLTYSKHSTFDEQVHFASIWTHSREKDYVQWERILFSMTALCQQQRSNPLNLLPLGWNRSPGSCLFVPVETDPPKNLMCASPHLSSQHCLDQWFSTGNNFAPQETFGNAWRHFWLPWLGGVGAPGV